MAQINIQCKNLIKNLNLKRLITTTIFIIFLNLLSYQVKSQITDLESQDYDNFKKRNILFMLTICNFNDTKCKNLRPVFDFVQEKFKSEHKVEIKFPFLDSNKLSEKLVNEYAFEGFPVTYLVNQSESEKEVYLGLRDLNSIYNYLKYKLIFVEENLVEAKSEIEAIDKINASKDKKALIILGDFKSYPNFSFALFQRAARKAGFENLIQIKSEELIEKYYVNDFDLAIYDANFKYENPNFIAGEEINNDEFFNFFRIKIKKNTKYEAENLSQAILIADVNKNKTNLFSNFKEETFEYAFNYGLPTVFYLYSNLEQIPKDLDDSLKMVASNYQNEFVFTKGSINNKILKSMKFVKHYNITKNDLPMILITKNPEEYFTKIPIKSLVTYNDDVDKYILKRGQLKEFVDTHLPSYLMKNNLAETSELTLSSEIVETFIEKIKDKIYPKINFHTYSEQIQMNGENFISVINEALEEENSIIVLMICPKSSKKYARIRSRIERVFNIIYEANDKKIIFDEFDPLINEITFIDYNYYPTIAIIQKSKTPKKWKVKLHNGKLTTHEITKFIKNSISKNIYENPLENDGEVSKFERENPLYPIHKLRFEGKLFSEGVITDKVNVGLKRRWFSLKRNRIFLNKGQLRHLEYPNNYEEDDITEEFEFEDDVIESHLHKNADEEQETKTDL